MNRVAHTRPARFLAGLFVVAALVAGCSRPPADPPKAATAATPAKTEPAPPSVIVPDDGPIPEGPGTRVLFIGNSLTAGHDVPFVVQAMAAAGGSRFLIRLAVLGGVNLEDHWRMGPAREMLERERWDYVVLQQAGSSLPENQADLKKWAVHWGKEIRQRGAKPALYMVWPRRTQKDAGFGLVSQSYRNAATAAEALILPAGEAWREAIKADPDIPLYMPDDLHQMVAGTYLAALVITHGLTGVRPDAVPSKLMLSTGQVIDIPADLADKLRGAATVVIDRDRPMK